MMNEYVMRSLGSFSLYSAVWPVPVVVPSMTVSWRVWNSQGKGGGGAPKINKNILFMPKMWVLCHSFLGEYLFL